ncbi:MAG: hypothetical protein ITG02_11705 [Patulibacter sp.]|nr:hypothetical protein [Patulibacter sp.]
MPFSISASRRLAGAGALVAVAALGVAPVPSASAASSSVCRAAVKASFPSSDPTALADNPRVKLRPVGDRRVSSLSVTVRRGKTRVATGTRRSALTRGGNPVSLRVTKRLRAGTYTVTTKAKVRGCKGTVTSTSRPRLKKPSLPVRAAVRGTSRQGSSTMVRMVLRPVADARPRNIRVRLKDSRDRTVATTTVSGTLRSATDVALTATGAVPGGRYEIEISGRASGTSGSTTQRVVLRSDAEVPASATPSRQRAVVDWKDGDHRGREIVGFVLPGIGHGELVCTPETQWVRVYPIDPRREVSMMNWTYRDWGGGNGKEIREALHTRFTGPDFSERFANFLPPEKTSTGEFIGLISDRGPYDSVGTGPYAPPISLNVRWKWDFSKAGQESCYAAIDLVAQTDDGQGPAVGSAQVVWRGDAAAAGRDVAVADVPGVGRLAVVCQAGVDGQRTAILGTPAGGTVIKRESTSDGSVPQAVGPIVVQLPNNGQVQVDVDGGARVLISSRWKINDPDPAQNSCAVAAQVVAAG